MPGVLPLVRSARASPYFRRTFVLPLKMGAQRRAAAPVPSLGRERGPPGTAGGRRRYDGRGARPGRPVTKEGAMQRLVGFSAACLGFIALVLLVIWIMGGFSNVHLSLAGWIAYILGVVLTSVLGVTLMALVFYSDRSGRDESAGNWRHE